MVGRDRVCAAHPNSGAKRTARRAAPAQSGIMRWLLSQTTLGGARGVCAKSKQSDMSSDAASLAFSGGRPKVFSQNLTMPTCEWKALEIPFFGVGTEHRATRGP